MPSLRLIVTTTAATTTRPHRRRRAPKSRRALVPLRGCEPGRRRDDLAMDSAPGEGCLNIAA